MLSLPGVALLSVFTSVVIASPAYHQKRAAASSTEVCPNTITVWASASAITLTVTESLSLVSLILF